MSPVAAHVSRRRGILAIALCLSSLGACTAISGLDRDYRLAETRGDASDGEPPRDAEAPQKEAAVDAVADAADASLDCERPPAGTIFCSTFDEASSPWGWGSAVSSGATLDVESGTGRDGSRALHAANVGAKSAYVSTTRPVTWSDGQTLTMRFSFRIASMTATYAAIGAIQFNGTEHGLAAYSTSPACNGAAPCVDDNDPSHRPHDPSGAFAFTPNQWYHAVVTLRASGAAWEGSVAVDGKTLYTSPTNAMIGALPRQIDVLAGAFYPGQSGGVDVYIDDVLVQLE